MELDFENPEVQANIFRAVSLMCHKCNMPVAGEFLQQQAVKAFDEHKLQTEVSEQDALLRDLEARSYAALDVPRLEYKAS